MKRFSVLLAAAALLFCATSCDWDDIVYHDPIQARVATAFDNGPSSSSIRNYTLKLVDGAVDRNYDLAGPGTELILDINADAFKAASIGYWLPEGSYLSTSSTFPISETFNKGYSVGGSLCGSLVGFIDGPQVRPDFYYVTGGSVDIYRYSGNEYSISATVYVDADRYKFSYRGPLNLFY